MKFSVGLDNKVVCDTPFDDVILHEVGGEVESEANLSQSGDSWLYEGTKVTGDVSFIENAKAKGTVKIRGEGVIGGDNIVDSEDDAMIAKLIKMKTGSYAILPF